MARPGRRAGGRDTRADILAAARTCFAESGYERTSLRQIARVAAVDAALVHHYFDGKAELFLAVMEMRRDPAAIFDEVQAAADKALALARAFIGDWEPRQPGGGPEPFATMLEAVCASPAVADALREFLTIQVWSRAREDGHPAGPNLRQALITSQLWGVALARYILRIEPLASASPDQAAEWLALLLQRTFDLPLPAPPESAPAPAPPVGAVAAIPTVEGSPTVVAAPPVAPPVPAAPPPVAAAAPPVAAAVPPAAAAVPPVAAAVPPVAAAVPPAAGTPTPGVGPAAAPPTAQTDPPAPASPTAKAAPVPNMCDARS